MSDVIVSDLQHVAIDGGMVGCVADAFGNFPDRRSDLQAALEEYLVEAVGKAVAAATADAKSQIETLTQERDAIAETAQNLKTELDQLSQKLCDQFQAKLDEQIGHLNARNAAVQEGAKLALDQASQTIQEREKLITDLQTQIAALKKEVAFQKDLTNRHWETTKRIIDEGKPGAVAAAQELRRLEIIGVRASLDAEEAAINASQVAKAGNEAA